MTAACALALLRIFYVTTAFWALHATSEAFRAVPADLGFLP